jgi:hypothetical protein
MVPPLPAPGEPRDGGPGRSRCSASCVPRAAGEEWRLSSLRPPISCQLATTRGTGCPLALNRTALPRETPQWFASGMPSQWSPQAPLVRRCRRATGRRPRRCSWCSRSHPHREQLDLGRPAGAAPVRDARLARTRRTAEAVDLLTPVCRIRDSHVLRSAELNRHVAGEPSATRTARPDGARTRAHGGRNSENCGSRPSRIQLRRQARSAPKW